ncbi:MAG: PEP-CTERM sorting domain-containing protein [Nitrosospira sp.]
MKIIHRFKIQSLILIVALNTCLSVVTPVFAQELSYILDLNSKKVTGLESLGYPTTPSGINATGQVVGVFSAGGGNQHAFITGPNGVGMTDLGTLGGGYSSASDINDAGQVVGVSYTTAGVSHAFITGPNGAGMTDLGTLGGSVDYSYATCVNDAGRVVGVSYTAAGTQHAFITGPNGVGMTDLGTLGGNVSFAFGINNAGQVVGVSSPSSPGGGPYAGVQHAFITGPNGAGMRDLGMPRGSYNDPGIYATSINDAGQVVGQTTNSEAESHAFITGPNGVGMTYLDILGGYNTSSFVTDINDAGQVVGHFWNASPPHAFVTGSNGVGMTDLNVLLAITDRVDRAYLDQAAAINNYGQVVILGAIPEPATYALMLAGLALIGFMVRSRSRLPKALLY